MKKFRKSNKGFTLVELIIVIAIIAILTVVAAPQYLKYVDKARLGKDQNEAASLQTLVEAYVIDVNSNEVTSDDVDDVVVEFTRTGVTAKNGDAAHTGLTTEISTNLPGIKVTNKGTYDAAYAKYTITITDGKLVTASTGWSAAS